MHCCGVSVTWWRNQCSAGLIYSPYVDWNECVSVCSSTENTVLEFDLNKCIPQLACVVISLTVRSCVIFSFYVWTMSIYISFYLNVTLMYFIVFVNVFESDLACIKYFNAVKLELKQTEWRMANLCFHEMLFCFNNFIPLLLFFVIWHWNTTTKKA